MILSNIKGITIPEGAVKQIADSAGRILWKGGAVDVATMAIGYSGAYTDQADVVMGDGKTYRLLTFTGSGTLTLEQSVKADVWLCAGGNGGRYSGGHGGGGGNFVQSNAVRVKTSTVCIIGSGGAAATNTTDAAGVAGSTSFGELEAAQVTGLQSQADDSTATRHASSCGASGGGAGGAILKLSATTRPGLGGGASTVPFLDTTLFEPHSAGGGGGGWRDREVDYENPGGKGGSDGANGGARGSSGYSGGAAGTKGGGKGGTGTSSTSSNKGGDATFYGSGGGGGGRYCSSSGAETVGNAGSGYQGVIYVRIPYEQ